MTTGVESEDFLSRAAILSSEKARRDLVDSLVRELLIAPTEEDRSWLLTYLAGLRSWTSSPACAPFGSVPGPFVGTTDDSGSPICTHGVLNEKDVYTVDGLPYSNSKIAIMATGQFDSQSEIYAQMFAIQVFVQTLKSKPGSMYNQTMDIMVVENAAAVANGQPFACTLAWAANRATGNLGVPTTYPTLCNVTIPGYTPGN